MMTDFEKIQHLYRRAGFGLSPVQWVEWRDKPFEHVLDALFAAEGRDDLLPLPEGTAAVEREAMTMRKRAMKDRDGEREIRKKGRLLGLQIATDWMERMGTTDYPLLEKMSLFWHGHFACRAIFPRPAVGYLNAIRDHALGSFRELVLAIASSQAMLRYLNNQQNRKNAPNENFARELLELFTIGRGNYTEQDIKEAARAFTGWRTNARGEFRFKPRQHDFGVKTFMGRSGKFNGDDIVDIILEQPATAHFVAGKVYRYFVHPEGDEAHIRELADIFYQSNYDIGVMMRHLFSADWMYESRNVGVRIKSPVELIAGLMRTFYVEFEEWDGVMNVLRALGQELLNPPNVAGWPGGEQWIDNATLMLRLQLVGYLFKSAEVDIVAKALPETKQATSREIKVKVDLYPLLQIGKRDTPQEVYAAFKSWLLAVPPRVDTDLLRRFTDNSDQEQFAKTLAVRLLSLPEYQLC